MYAIRSYYGDNQVWPLHDPERFVCAADAERACVGILNPVIVGKDAVMQMVAVLDVAPSHELDAIKISK